MSNHINIGENTHFDTTGTLKSLMIGIDCLPNPKENFIIIEGDLVCDNQIINNFLKESDNILVGDSSSVLEDESMRFNLKDNNIINNISKDLNFNNSSGEAIGLLRVESFSKNKFCNYANKILNNNSFAFYEEIIDKTDIKFKLLDINPYKWTEIDFTKDYKKARQIFTDIKVLDIDVKSSFKNHPSIFLRFLIISSSENLKTVFLFINISLI